MSIKFYTNIDLDDNQALNLVVQLLSSNPATKEGKIYYNTTTNIMMVCIESTWTALFPAKGDQGDKGNTGNNGTNGTNGKDGAAGKDGATGDRGATGAKGDTGDTPTMTSLSGSSLPTSNRGLSSGKLWNNRGVVSIA